MASQMVVGYLSDTSEYDDVKDGVSSYCSVVGETQSSSSNFTAYLSWGYIASEDELSICHCSDSECLSCGSYFELDTQCLGC
jgi:hypothetical protein